MRADARIHALTISEKRLNNILAVIEGALDSNTVHIWVENTGHLQLLNLGNPAFRKKDEALHVLLAPLQQQ
jgi:hypothetical protein